MNPIKGMSSSDGRNELRDYLSSLTIKDRRNNLTNFGILIMDEDKVLNLSATADLGLHLCVNFAHSTGNEKLLKFVTDNEEILKSIFEKDLFGKLDTKEKLTVGHLIKLHEKESQNTTCNHLPS